MKIKLEPSPLEFRPKDKPRVQWERWGWPLFFTFVFGVIAVYALPFFMKVWGK